MIISFSWRRSAQRSGRRMLLRALSTTKTDDDPPSSGDDDAEGTESNEEPQLEEACLFLAVMSCLVCCCFASCILRRLRRISGGLSARYLSAELTQPLLDGGGGDIDHDTVIGSARSDNNWKCPVCCMMNPGRLSACDICSLSQAEAEKRFQVLEQFAHSIAAGANCEQLSARQRSAARRRRWRKRDGKWHLQFDVPQRPISSRLIIFRPIPPKFCVIEAFGAVVLIPQLEVKSCGAQEEIQSSIDDNFSDSSAPTEDDWERENIDSNNEAALLEAGTRRMSKKILPHEEEKIPCPFEHDETSFAARHLWFEKELDKNIRAPVSEGHARIEVRRSQLLEDSVQQLLALNNEDIRRWMRVQFVDEPGIDVGGLEREWFGLATEAIFTNEVGIFYFDKNASSYYIQPSAGLPPALGGHPRADELFEFIGRLIGKAILEHVPLAAPLAIPLWKQLICQPLDFDDFEDADPALARTLNWLLNNSLDDISQLHLDFSVAIPQAKLLCNDDTSLSCCDADFFENHEFVPSYAVLDADTFFSQQKKTTNKVIVRQLIPDGHLRAVDSHSTKIEYAQKLWHYHLIDAHRRALWYMAKGLYAVIPPAMLCIFDAHELELLVCGSRSVDIDDWARNTDYTGDYRRRGAKHPVIVWFWTVLRSWDHHQRSKFLQFCTGSNRVPCHGFAALQRNDGKYQKFSIQSLPRSEIRFPRAHTCFNRLDLPIYGSKQELQTGLEVILSMDTTGFTMD
uniref:HECT-type E3 ubiquitin transferase n=1 Tax=Aureoumbra lagunensis TaxID=44058 RepID=A0A7S3JVZ5_9STRA|mmetsp:Transcript_20276/g.26255  ORF Transcript_20276/g.26255 Transcript_20276/m.26255 type:complete len:740 (+) Transcript_20276:65-2284(+)